MKNVRKLSYIAIATLLLLGNTFPAVAATQSSDFEYLRAAIATVNAVPSEEINQYIADNREWIDDIGLRMDVYLLTIPEAQRNDTITRLMGGNPLTRSGNLDEYFNFTTYHYRGDYWTYSMNPKWGVRLWGPTMQAAWAELGIAYAGIRNDNGSLWNQYECHWNYDAFGLLAGDWDLEVGRPIVSGFDMLTSLCNP
jgi:hypothetical protein